MTNSYFIVKPCSQTPKAQNPKGPGADTKILWDTHHPTPPTPYNF